MQPSAEEFTIGVEEEFLLVDPETRRLVAAADDVLPEAGDDSDRLQHELQLSQVETGTGVCRTLEQVREEVVRLRRSVAEAAARAGSRIASSGTHPLPFDDSSRVTPKASYRRLERDYRLIAREQVVCGCHVHVGVSDPEAAIQVMNRARPWLPVLLALSANSPFWQGKDTGYASFRSEVWRRWPMAGPPELFASRSEFDELVRTLTAVDAIDDPARIYWDARPSARFDTLEFRVADAGLSVDDTVMVAGLVLGLVRTCHGDVVSGRPALVPRAELVRAAMWRAARFGIDGTLIDLDACRSRPAGDVVGALLQLLRPALEEHGEWDEVSRLVRQVQRTGTGSARQRRVFARDERVEDVVDFVVAETVRGPAG
jgi:carboxylate-amine ligase